MALLWALVTAMADAIGDVMMGKISKTSNPILASVPLAVVMILLFFIASLFGSSLHFDSASLLYGTPIGILLAIANILFYKAMAIGPMAMVSVTSSLAPLLPLGFDVLTGNAPNAVQATSFALMVAGICLVASHRESTTSTLTKSIRAMSPLPMAIASATLYGLIDILFELGDTSNMLGLLMVIQIAKLITTIPLAAFVIERNGRERIPVVKTIPAGLVYAIGWIVLYLSARQGEIDITSALEYTSPFFVAILAYFYVDERLSRLQISGLLAVFAGILVLTLYSHHHPEMPQICGHHPKSIHHHCAPRLR